MVFCISWNECLEEKQDQADENKQEELNKLCTNFNSCDHKINQYKMEIQDVEKEYTEKINRL